MDNAVGFSDASLFAMSIPNLIGVYFLMPVVFRELNKFIEFTRKIDDGETVHEAWEQVEHSKRSDS
jgi:AGCS family alanine or glycine:cation symporter